VRKKFVWICVYLGMVTEDMAVRPCICMRIVIGNKERESAVNLIIILI
jgi:hypothetical protein